MNRAEIIEGLKEVYYRSYAITDHRKTLEACLALLENENALLDKVLEIIDQMDKENEKCNGDISRLLLRIEHKDFRERVLALKGEQE